MANLCVHDIVNLVKVSAGLVCRISFVKFILPMQSLALLSKTFDSSVGGEGRGPKLTTDS